MLNEPKGATNGTKSRLGIKSKDFDSFNLYLPLAKELLLKDVNFVLLKRELKD